MRCLCLTGGMDIKTISLIFSRHGFTVQEKAKANKPQTQEKIAIIHLLHGCLHGTEPNPGPPSRLAADLALPAPWLGASSSPKLELERHSAKILHTDSHLPWQYSFWTGAALHLANSGSTRAKAFFWLLSNPVILLGASP